MNRNHRPRGTRWRRHPMRSCRRHFVKIVFVITAIIAVVAYLGSIAEQPSQPSAIRLPPNPCTDLGAYTASQKIVTARRLNAPATADFPWMSDGDVTITQVGECTFRVEAYVDAESSFSEKIRTRYAMDIWFDRSDNGWKATNIRLFE